MIKEWDSNPNTLDELAVLDIAFIAFFLAWACVAVSELITKFVIFFLKEVDETQLSGMPLDFQDRWILPLSVVWGRGAKHGPRFEPGVYRKSDNQANALPTEPTVTIILVVDWTLLLT